MSEPKAVERLAAVQHDPRPEPPSHDQRKRFELLTPAELTALPPMEWAVHHVLPRRGLAAIFGPSQAMKGFLGVDLFAHLAEGMPWFGHRIPRKLRVVVLVLEGAGGYPTRIRGWEAVHDRSYPENVRFYLGTFDIMDADQRRDLGLAIALEGGCDVLFVDTMTRATPGVDEISGRDMSEVIQACAEMEHLICGGLITLVAHTGKDLERGLRAHSSLEQAVDCAIQVHRPDPKVAVGEWTTFKGKDGPTGVRHGFRCGVVNLGVDEHGETITTLVLEPIEAQSVHVMRVVEQAERARAESTVLAGIPKLKAMGIDASDKRNADGYLPKQLLAKALNDGFDRTELAGAVDRLMTSGRLKRDVVGTYGGASRAKKEGLVIVEHPIQECAKS